MFMEHTCEFKTMWHQDGRRFVRRHNVKTISSPNGLVTQPHPSTRAAPNY